MEKRESNYEIMKHRMQAEFAGYDMDAIAKEWELESDDKYLYLTFLSTDLRIDRRTGAVLDGEKEADHNVSMTLYDMLTRKRAASFGEMKSTNAFSQLYSSTLAFTGVYANSAKTFDGRAEELRAACEKLGGTPFGKGDVGYKIPVFRDLCVAIQFYESDEEFPAQLNFFCDANILSFMYFETMWYMLGAVLDRIKALLPR